jgi:hypothetical protein
VTLEELDRWLDDDAGRCTEFRDSFNGRSRMA